MGGWYLSLGLSLLCLLAGLYVHWSLVVLAVLLPVWPVLSQLLRRRLERRSRRRGSRAPE